MMKFNGNGVFYLLTFTFDSKIQANHCKMLSQRLKWNKQFMSKLDTMLTNFLISFFLSFRLKPSSQFIVGPESVALLIHHDFGVVDHGAQSPSPPDPCPNAMSTSQQSPARVPIRTRAHSQWHRLRSLSHIRS